MGLERHFWASVDWGGQRRKLGVFEEEEGGRKGLRLFFFFFFFF